MDLAKADIDVFDSQTNFTVENYTDGTP
jgi:hypothetical protein